MRQIYRQFRAHVLQRLIPPRQPDFDPDSPTEVVGFLTMTSGLAESARLCADALAATGHPVHVRDVSPHDREASAVSWAAPPKPDRPPSSRILHLNPPM